MTAPDANGPKGMVPVLPAYPAARLLPVGEYADKPPIHAGRVLTLIGSGLEAQIRLRSRTISKRHALLLNADGKMVLRDLASTTHVFVNGQQVQEVILADGDQIQLGRITLTLECGPRLESPASSPPPPARLQLNSSLAPAVAGPIFVIGRQEDCGLRLPDDEVARAHAVIFEAAGRRILRHLAARSVTCVNGQNVAEVILGHGDVIEIAGRRMVYELEASPPILKELPNSATARPTPPAEESLHRGDEPATSPLEQAAPAASGPTATDPIAPHPKGDQDRMTRSGGEPVNSTEAPPPVQILPVTLVMGEVAPGADKASTHAASAAVDASSPPPPGASPVSLPEPFQEQMNLGDAEEDSQAAMSSDSSVFEPAPPPAKPPHAAAILRGGAPPNAQPVSPPADAAGKSFRDTRVPASHPPKSKPPPSPEEMPEWIRDCGPLAAALVAPKSSPRSGLDTDELPRRHRKSLWIGAAAVVGMAGILAAAWFLIR